MVGGEDSVGYSAFDEVASFGGCLSELGECFWHKGVCRSLCAGQLLPLRLSAQNPLQRDISLSFSLSPSKTDCYLQWTSFLFVFRSLD